MSERQRAIRIALVGLAVHLLVCASHLYAFHGDPTVFLHFGSAQNGLGTSEQERELAHARSILGSVQTPNEDGHDARYFWILARDPLLLHVDDLVAYTDRPLYRAQRIGYPLVVAPWRLFGERALVFGMLLTNLGAVFLGGYLCSRLAQELGIPERAGLAFALNPGVLLGVVFDMSDALALLFLVCAMLAIVRERIGWAAVAGACAVLTKEPSFLAVLGISVLSARWAVGPGARPRELTLRARALLVLAAAIAGGGWAIYVRMRLGWVSPHVVEFGAPFVGYFDALREYWLPADAYLDALVSTLVTVSALAIGYRWMKRRTLLLRAAVPYAVMIPFLSYAVMHLMTNSLRALAPALTFVVLDIYATQTRAAAAPSFSTT